MTTLEAQAPRRLPALRGAGGWLLAVVLIALPFVGGDYFAYQLALFLIYGIAAQGVALCWGRVGFLPLGHALFFGLGAYLSAGVLKLGEQAPAWLALLPLALLLPAAFAWVLARLVFARSARSGPYFSLITLALTMLGFLVAQRWSAVTGGFNGLAGIPDLPGTDRYGNLYWVIAACAVASTLLLGALLRRPLGLLWRAIAQNEDRLQFFGMNTARLKADAFGLSALLAAVAGGLFAAHQGIVTPLAMGFVLSTEFVIWAAVGGKASPLGALAGAVIVGYASSELRDHVASWEVFVGVAFILIVRFLPDGVAGLFQRGAAAPEAPEPIDAPAIRWTRPQPALRYEAVGSQHAGVTILDGLSLQLQGPGIRCMIGPNGAGKTSSFNVLTGRLPMQQGSIRVGDDEVAGRAAWRIARMGIARKFQIPAVFPELSVRQNLAIALWAGRLHGLDLLRRAPLAWHTPLLDELLELFPALRTQSDMPAGRLSQGHRQALEFVMTVLPQPWLVLLDEPCAGLSPAETARMIDAIRIAIRRIGAAALIIEHDMSAVAAIAEHVYVLHQGRLLAEGSLAQVQADPQVRAVYAGAGK